MPRDGPFSSLPFPFRDLEIVTNPYTCNAKNVVNGLNISFNLGRDFVTRSRNFTHLQCACEGAEQSTTDGADHIVQRRGYVLFGFDSVKGLDSTMDTEPYWFLEAFKISMSYRTSYTFES